MTRPTKLTPARQAKILEALISGNTVETSAAYAGIHKGTFYNWFNRGEKAKSGIYFDFFNAIKKAQADAEVRNVAIIQKAANKSWQAAAWWLERRKYADWGKKEKQEVEHSTKDNKPLPISIISLDVDMGDL